MLQSTFELISLAASNSHMIFCLFNLLVAAVVVSSSKSNNNQNRKPISSVVDENGEHSSVSLPEKATGILVEAAGTDEDKDDEDLKIRVEAFIQKMNKGWRDDKVRSSHMFFQDFEVHRVVS